MSRAILWDMDGTLLDSEPAHEAAFGDALRELDLSVPPGFYHPLLGASVDRVHAALIAATGAHLSLDDWRKVKWRHFQRYAGAVAPLPEAVAIARGQAARGTPMAVVSNSTAEEVTLCLTAAGLAPLFPVTVSRADVVTGKPAPDGYLLAAARLGIPPANCVVVEDSPVGARAGAAAGMTVLFRPQQKIAAALPPGVIHVPPALPLAPALRAALSPKVQS